MFEQSKAAQRRVISSGFPPKAFSGSGIDIGAGPDPVSKTMFPDIQSVRDWDKKDGDAQYMASVADNSVDFVNSSHCLEHMVDPSIALSNWIRIVRPGGYLVVTVPDEDLYEHGMWPSRFNTDHKWSFTTKPVSVMPKSINVNEFLEQFDSVDVVYVKLIDTGFDYSKPKGIDQTMGPAECAIEFVLRKK
jgi:ubiquinone/menaquinone biosynthesis C-methylase UbiE